VTSKVPALYGFGPFSLTSELALPELPPASSEGLGVKIVVESVPGAISAPTFATALCSASRNEFLLHIPDVARYYIRNGREVKIQPDPNSSELDIRGYLLGNIFAVLCHQRRLLPLHASAVRIGNGAIAFLGDSGAGKSTLAAFLLARGHSLVADDVCLLDPDADQSNRVIPVAPWLKLWPSSLEVLGRGPEGLSRTFHDEEKYRVPVSESARVDERRLPLRALVFLKRSDDAPDSATSDITLLPLAPAQQMVQTMRFTYQQYLLEWLGLQEEHFARCSLAIAGAEVFVCTRPWGFAALESLAQLLEKNFV
jgi:hypothetical protein